MENPQDLDPTRDGPVEDQILPEARYEDVTDVGESGTIGLESDSNAGQTRQAPEGRVGRTEEMDRQLWAATPTQIKGLLSYGDRRASVYEWTIIRQRFRTTKPTASTCSGWLPDARYPTLLAWTGDWLWRNLKQMGREPPVVSGGETRRLTWGTR